MSYKQFSFFDWIDEVTPKRIAKLFKVNPQTVRQWRKGISYPSVIHMKRIKKITRGEISYEKIIDRKG